MNRLAQAVVLFLVGVSVLRTGFTDLHLRYVKAGLRPLLLLAGAVLITTAAATAFYEWRARRTARVSGAHGTEEAGTDPAEAVTGHGGGPSETVTGHGEEPSETATGQGRGIPETAAGQGAGHVHRESRVSWLLVLPLIALILVAPPALGSYSAMRAGTALQAQPLEHGPLPAGDPVRLGLAEYAERAVHDGGRTLGGRRVEVTGFLALDGAGKPYLVRMTLNCCAADAQPLKVALTGALPPVLRPDTWVRVTGTYADERAEDPVNGGVIPYLSVSALRPVEAPRDPYDDSGNG